MGPKKLEIRIFFDMKLLNDNMDMWRCCLFEYPSVGPAYGFLVQKTVYSSIHNIV
jgi:hypothetical protein